MKPTWISIPLLIILTFGTFTAPVLAQGEDSAWSEPINLSNTLTNSEYPAIAADPAGGVHVIWLETLSSAEIALLYTALFDGNWTTPIDIVPGVAVGGQGAPSLLADGEGTLHLAYLKNEGIAYTQAFAPQAGSAKAWQEPVILVPAQNDQGRFDLAIGSGAAEGLICLAHAQQIGASSGVFVTCSRDAGLTWDPPYTVYANLDTGKIVNKPSLAIGSDGGLHLVWVVANYPETYPPLGLRYARSTDGGLTWRQFDLAEGPYDDPALSICAEPEVHVVWSGTADDRYRFHRWSPDYGTTWFDTYRNLTGGGTLGYADLVCDSGGDVHWFTPIDDFLLFSEGEQKDALYHSVFVKGEWLHDEIVLRGEVQGQNLMHVSADVSLGNQIHIVVGKPLALSQATFRMEMFYSSNIISTPQLSAVPLVQHPQPQDDLPLMNQTPLVEIAEPASLDGPLTQPDTAPWSAVSLGGSAALLAVFLVVVVHVTRSRR